MAALKGKSGEGHHLALLREEHVRLQSAMGSLQRKYDLLAAQSKDPGAADTDSFLSRLLALVASLFDKDTYSDIRIELDGHIVPAHRFVLAARSQQWGVDNLAAADKLQFGNLSYTIGYTMLKWVYTDELGSALGDSLVLDLMKAAKHFGLPGLFKRCEERLVSRLDVSNCVAVYSAAEEINANALAERCAALISAHWEELGPADLSSMSAQLLYKILRSKVQYPLHASISLHREDVVFLYLIEFHAQVRYWKYFSFSRTGK